MNETTIQRAANASADSTVDVSTQADSPTADIAQVLVALVPIGAVLVVDPGGWFPFSIAKWAAVLTTGLATLAALLASRCAVAVSRTSAALLGTLIALVLLSGAIAGVDRYAWVGTPVRHLGAFTWLFFGAMFVVGSQRWLRTSITQGMTLAAALLGVYVGVEAVWGAPVDYVTNSSRLGGPFGSAAYLGAATSLLLPVAAGMMLDRSAEARWRGVALVGVVGGTAGLFGAGSRAALIGVAAAIGVLAVARTMRRGTVCQSWSTAVAGAVGAGAAGAIGAGVIAIRAGVFERSVGADSRIDEWVLAIRAVRRNPLLGAGPEGYRNVVGGVIDADYARRYGDAVFVDRAHNGVLDVAVTSGVLAAAVYIAVFGVVAVVAIRCLRASPPTTVGLAVGVLAYMVQQQFLFPIAEIDPVFWLAAGAVTISHGATFVVTPTRPAAKVAALVAASLTLGAMWVGVRAVAADRQASASLAATTVESAIERVERAVDLAPYDVRLHLLLADAEEGRATAAGLDAAVDAVDSARRITPDDPAVLIERARLISLRAEVTDSDMGPAVRAWRDLVEASPACARCQLGLGLTLRQTGDDACATAALRTAADLGDEQARREFED